MDNFCEHGLCNLHCSFHKPRNIDTSLNHYKRLVAQQKMMWSIIVKKTNLVCPVYHEAVSVITDTDPTTIKARWIFVQWSLKGGGSAKWLGCIDHLLRLVTRKSIFWFYMSEGTLKACQNLVNIFNSSPQEITKPLGKQVEGRAVKPIQDVTTRWWSTYAMCNWLIRLKMYL